MFPELVTRSSIASATRIANPGCYATAAQLAIAPLVSFLGGQPTVFGVSGYSGAGTKPSRKNDVTQLADNLMAYALTDHIHEREVSTRLGAQVGFIPHVASWFQGIHQTINIPLNKEMTSKDIQGLYQERYAGESLVKIIDEAPEVKSISGKHGVVSDCDDTHIYMLANAFYRKLVDLAFTRRGRGLLYAPPLTTS